MQRQKYRTGLSKAFLLKQAVQAQSSTIKVKICNLCVCTYVSIASSVIIQRRALGCSDSRRGAGGRGRGSRGDFGARLTFLHTHAFVQTVVQVRGGGRIIAQTHLSVGVVSSLPAPTSSSSITSRVPSSTLGAGGDLRKLASVGGPQVCLGAPAVEEQEVHASWAALTNSWAKDERRK